MREATVSDNGQECTQCRTVLPSSAPYCNACGCPELRLCSRPRFPYDALAAFIGVMAVVLYWIGRA